jgi:peptide/nickel transport system ATP-binding protein
VDKEWHFLHQKRILVFAIFKIKNKTKLNVAFGSDQQSMTLLSVENLNVVYPTDKGLVRAVQNLSFDVNTGESIGIVGESGCGKTTLGLSIIRTILGGNIESGDISIDNQSILKLTEQEFDSDYRWKKISMIFQGAMNSLDPVYTVYDQLSGILKQHASNDDDLVKTLLSNVGLDESVLAKYPHELSGGMKQRVIIAMALLLKPKLIIADEPTTALDVLVQSQILNLFKSLKKQSVSFVVISHDLGVISEICEKIGIMYAGQMIEFGTSEQILKNPQHPYTKALLKSIPKLGASEKPNFITGEPPSLIEPKVGCRFASRCPDVMKKCEMDPNYTENESGYVRCWLYE